MVNNRRRDPIFEGRTDLHRDIMNEAPVISREDFRIREKFIAGDGVSDLWGVMNKKTGMVE